jgi:hypothetical protein
MIKVTRETKAELTTSTGGRVLVWTNDKEASQISIAVPGDRVRLTAVQATALAAALLDMAKTVDAVTHSPLRDAAKTFGGFGRVSGL